MANIFDTYLKSLSMVYGATYSFVLYSVKSFCTTFPYLLTADDMNSFIKSFSETFSVALVSVMM